jgi:hypothetical protein
MTLFPPFPPCSHSGGNTFLQPNSLPTYYLLLLVLPCSHCSHCFEIRDYAQCAGAGARVRIRVSDVLPLRMVGSVGTST